jgi:hypothetical protein
MLRLSGDTSYPSTSAHRKDHIKGEGPQPSKDVTVSREEDEKTQLLSQGLTLLLAARERVLTLSEQRVRPFFPSILPVAESFALASRSSYPATDITLYVNFY